MAEPARKPIPAELAARIEGADRPSRQDPAGLRFQWNVPLGVTPRIPIWFAMLVVGLLVGLPALSLLLR